MPYLSFWSCSPQAARQGLLSTERYEEVLKTQVGLLGLTVGLMEVTSATTAYWIWNFHGGYGLKTSGALSSRPWDGKMRAEWHVFPYLAIMTGIVNLSGYLSGWRLWSSEADTFFWRQISYLGLYKPYISKLNQYLSINQQSTHGLGGFD